VLLGPVPGAIGPGADSRRAGAGPGSGASNGTGPGPAPLADALIWVEGEALDAIQGALDRRPVQAQPLCKLTKRGFGFIDPGLSHETYHIRLFGQSTIGLQYGNRLEISRRGRHGPLQIGRLGVDDTIYVAPNRPGHLP